MTKRLRVIAIVIGLLAVFSGNVSAYSEENLNVTIIEGNKKSAYERPSFGRIHVSSFLFGRFT